MNTRSIGFRLTAWYFAILAAALSLFGAGMWAAMRRSIQEAVDEELRDRLAGVRRFMEELIPGGQAAEVQNELAEHAGFAPGGDLLQIQDDRGVWIYQSPALKGYNVPAWRPGQLPRPLEYQTVRVQAARLRVLSAKVPIQGNLYTVQIGHLLDEFDEVLERFGWIVLSSLPVVLILASVGGYWMSRRALAPVDQITHLARSISIQNLSQRLVIPQTGDELQRLSETLNDMLQRLDAAVKRITQFTADASHELRTPIAVMRTNAELAVRRRRSEPEYREALSLMLAELERTSNLVENLMLLARADSGAEALHLVPIDLAESVREACGQGRTLAQAREVQFDFTIPPAAVPVEGDHQALRRLFLILIDNAIKYTASGGRISVSLSAVDGSAVGEVRDSGIGIAPDDLPNIFERFYRADKARSREMGGAGLGLSIAHWIVEAHRGNIQVESEPGRGSIFRVGLPLRKA